MSKCMIHTEISANCALSRDERQDSLGLLLHNTTVHLSEDRKKEGQEGNEFIRSILSIMLLIEVSKIYLKSVFTSQYSSISVRDACRLQSVLVFDESLQPCDDLTREVLIPFSLRRIIEHSFSQMVEKESQGRSESDWKEQFVSFTSF